MKWAGNGKARKCWKNRDPNHLKTEKTEQATRSPEPATEAKNPKAHV